MRVAPEGKTTLYDLVMHYAMRQREPQDKPVLSVVQGSHYEMIWNGRQVSSVNRISLPGY
ncbi:hypothetical protein [Thiopseudomonas denitrificans]|uniref:hypothetical protein n=1 Tax=Thiopseudomonas denitrificans TaxID=1501432 RepID=UPI000C783F5D|nr:hypothetical protein [Thiopseudomonas denitrificans]